MSAPAASSFFQKLAATVAWSILLKLFTFTLTTCVTRSVTPEVRGVAFYLDLYVDFLGFLAKEAVRSTTLRSPVRHTELGTQAARRRCMMDVIFLFNAAAWAVVSAVVMLACNELVAWLVGPGQYILPSFLGAAHRVEPMHRSSMLLSVVCFFGGLVLQTLAEPMVCLTQSLMHYRKKVSAESAALSCRLLVFLAAAVGSPHVLRTRPLLVGSVAHLIYGVMYFCSFELSWVFAARKSRQLGAKAVHDADALVAVISALHSEGEFTGSLVGCSMVTVPLMMQQARRLRAVWWQFLTESVVRIVITEGEKLALAALGTLGEQGVFDAVSNLGGIITRLVFRLWEESSFARWSSMMSNVVLSDGPSGTSPTSRLHKWLQCYSLLESMLGISVQVSMPFVLFGPPLSQPLLWLLYSDRWGGDESAAVLSRLCVAIPFMAVNGLLEAFIRATSSTKGLQRAKFTMFITSAIYVSCCFALLSSTERGVVGLMEALVVATCARLLFSALLIQQEYAALLGTEAADATASRPSSCNPLLRVFTWLPATYWSSTICIAAIAWRCLQLRISALSDIHVSFVITFGALVLSYAAIAAIFDGPGLLVSNLVRRVCRCRR